MTIPFLLEIPPRGQIEEIGQHSRIQCIGYHGDPERRHALEATIGCIEAYTSERTAMEIAAALESAPELCALASVVNTVLGSRQMDASDALAALQAIRSSTNPEWARAIAGREIIAQDLAHAGQHAVCDASEVVPEDREPMTKYRAERAEEFPDVDWFSQKPCQITFEQHAAKTINDGWRYSQYWTRVEWPRQALRDCDKRIASVDKDRANLQDVRTGLIEICAEMDERQKEDAMGVKE